jgi:hypothetical protein
MHRARDCGGAIGAALVRGEAAESRGRMSTIRDLVAA